MHAPCELTAQSMGGYVALRAALAAPQMVRHLVLAVTSGGVPVRDLGGADWEAEYYAAYPHAARWISDPTEDLSERLGALNLPVLLIWGSHDPISPLAVGERLLALLPRAELHVIDGAGHDLAQTHPREVASLIARHLETTDY